MRFIEIFNFLTINQHFQDQGNLIKMQAIEFSTVKF